MPNDRRIENVYVDETFVLTHSTVINNLYQYSTNTRIWSAVEYIYTEYWVTISLLIIVL